MDSQEHILVTGGAGMIGSNLVKRLASLGYRVSVVDNLWRGRKEYLLNNDENGYVIDMENDFHLVDLTEPQALDPLLDGVNYIYHLAEIVAGVGYVFCNQGDVFHKNILINTNVIASARSRPLKGFIYVGTACSFPADMQTGVEAPPLKEEDQYPASPESAYGWSKLMGEYETFLIEEETDIPVSVLVLHNVYGTPCDYSDERGQVIPSIIRKAVRYPDESFNIWGSGSQGRAFVHVNDVVDALVDTLNNGLGKGVIQIGPDICISIREIAELVADISGKSIDIQYDLTKPEGDRGRCADYTRAEKVLGWQPRTELQDGLRELYSWIKKVDASD